MKRCLGCMETYSDELNICPHCGYVENSMPEEAIHMIPGTILHGQYIVGKVVGYGGFGVTYIAWDSVLEKRVAIKEYLPSEFSTRMPGKPQLTVFNGDKAQQFNDGLKKFLDEARRLAKFQSSPNLCVNSSSSYVSSSMLPLSSGDLIEWSLVCHSTLSYQKFCD